MNFTDIPTLIGLFFGLWWVVGLVVIGPILLIGWLADQLTGNNHRADSIPPPAHPISPIKINHHPIHWQDPK